MKVKLGQLWREKETALHRSMGVEPQTARVVDLLANGKVRLEKVSGCGKARFRTMKLENLHKHHEPVSQ